MTARHAHMAWLIAVRAEQEKLVLVGLGKEGISF